VPLAWIPVLCDHLGPDSTQTMRDALHEQWISTLMAIAGCLIWSQGRMECEIINFFTEVNGGEAPDFPGDPERLERLRKAFRGR